MNEIMGWIGISLLLLSYSTLLLKNSEILFKLINIVASMFLVIHAYLIHDIIFFLVNSFIIIILVLATIKDFKVRNENFSNMVE